MHDLLLLKVHQCGIVKLFDFHSRLMTLYVHAGLARFLRAAKCQIKFYC